MDSKDNFGIHPLAYVNFLKIKTDGLQKYMLIYLSISQSLMSIIRVIYVK